MEYIRKKRDRKNKTGLFRIRFKLTSRGRKQHLPQRFLSAIS